MAFGDAVGDIFYPAAAAGQIILAALILASGRINPLRAGFALLLVLSGVLTLGPSDWPPVPGTWRTYLDSCVLWTAAFLLTQFPRPPTRQRVAVMVRRTWYGGLALIVTMGLLREGLPWEGHEALGPLPLDLPFGFRYWVTSALGDPLHDSLVMLGTGVLAVRTLPLLRAADPGPGRVQSALVVAGLGAALVEVAFLLGILFIRLVDAGGPFAGYTPSYIVAKATYPVSLFFAAVAIGRTAWWGGRDRERDLLFIVAAFVVAAYIGGSRMLVRYEAFSFLPPLPPEIVSQALRPVLIGVALLRFDLFQAPAVVRRAVVPVLFGLGLVSGFAILHSAFGGTALRNEPFSAPASLGAAACLAIALWWARRPLALLVLSEPRHDAAPDRKTVLRRYRLELERSAVSTDPAARDDLRALRSALGITQQEHDAMLALLEGNVLVPSHVVFGARPGAVIGGRYRVERELGQGGQGQAVLATDLETPQPVVLKQPLNPWAADAETRLAALRREAKAARRIDSPHVARVHALVEEPWATYLVRDFIPGATLEERVRTGGPLAPRAAAKLGAGLFSALATIHEAGLLHLDAKPGNIVLTDDGGPVLIDLGTVQRQEAGHALDETLPAAGPAAITRRWAAPEQVAGGAVSPATDIYQAAGCVLYALTGDLGLRSTPEGAPGPILEVLAAARHPDPLRRPASASAIAEGLRRVADGAA